MRDRKRLGDMLVLHGCVSHAQLDEALEAQEENGGRLGTNLLILGYLEEEDLARFLSDQLGLPAVDRIEPVAEAIRRRVPADLAQIRMVFPLGMQGDTLRLAMADPEDEEAIQEVEAAAKCRVQPVVAPELVVTHAILKQYDLSPEPEYYETNPDQAAIAWLRDPGTWDVNLTV